MKQLTWFAVAIFVMCFVGAAYSQVGFPTPKPRPLAAPETTAGAVVQQPSPTAPAAPAPAPAGWSFSDILQVIWTLIGGAFTAAVAKIAVKPAAAPSPGAPVIPAGVATVLNKLKDPSTLDGLEAMGLRVVQTGIPGQLIQSGASLIPGVGPFAAQLEPLLRKVVTEALERKVAQP